MFQKTLLVAAAGLFAIGASAQQCSTLAATGTGAPGTTVTFDVSGGSAHAMTVLLAGETQGSTTVNLGPLGSLTLGLDMPFAPLPLGMTNMTGDLSRTFTVPSAATLGFDLYGQALSIGFSFAMPPGGGWPTFQFTTCTSNVVPFHVGV